VSDVSETASASIIRIPVDVGADIDESLMVEAETQRNVRNLSRTDIADRQEDFNGFTFLPLF
jgi:hypothetical protein